MSFGRPWRSPLRALAEACVQQPLRLPVPDDAAGFAARKGPWRMALRTARHHLLLRCSGQLPTLRQCIKPGWSRVLWIHEGMPQIGDALMDLAPRSLLAERGMQVDLFASEHIATLFERDAWFAHSLHRPDDVRVENYDVAIVLSHDHKARVSKRARVATLPWVSLQGFYGGPDFHRARFVTQRLADLLSQRLAPEEFAWHSAQKLRVKPEAADWAAHVQAAPGGVALVLGGVWPARTYRHWVEILSALYTYGMRSFVLIGSANGRAMADQLAAHCAADMTLADFVGRTTLPQAHALLAQSAAVVCTDGGLMHLALTTTTPVVALFNTEISPEWRFPVHVQGIGLRSPGHEVSEIAPELIAEATAMLLGVPK